MDGGGREESDTTERLHFHFSPSCIGEGNGNPLQCFCLKNYGWMFMTLYRYQDHPQEKEMQKGKIVV